MLGIFLFAFSILISLLANGPELSLPFIFASFAVGGLAIAISVICLIRQRKRTSAKKKDAKAVAGMILGIVPFLALFLISLAAQLIQ